MFKRVVSVIAAVLALSYIALLFANSGHELPMESEALNTERNQTVAIFGATGTIGDGLLKAAINDPNVTKIYVVTRRPSPRIEIGIESGRVEMMIHKDYLDYAAIEENLADVDTVFWAIGLSAVGLDRETYREIHSTYPLRFVEAWASATGRKDTSFHYVSGSGADADSRMMWAQEKARAEAELANLAAQTSMRVVSYRPAFIRPTEAEAHIGHKMMHAILNPIGSSVEAESIGAAMLAVSARAPGVDNGTILNNRDIIRMGDIYEERWQKSR